MAITLAKIQSLSDCLHYDTMNIAPHNGTSDGIIQVAIQTVDAELKLQVGTVHVDPATIS